MCENYVLAPGSAAVIWRTIRFHLSRSLLYLHAVLLCHFVTVALYASQFSMLSLVCDGSHKIEHTTLPYARYLSHAHYHITFYSLSHQSEPTQPSPCTPPIHTNTTSSQLQGRRSILELIPEQLPCHHLPAANQRVQSRPYQRRHTQYHLLLISYCHLDRLLAPAFSPVPWSSLDHPLVHRRLHLQQPRLLQHHCRARSNHPKTQTQSAPHLQFIPNKSSSPLHPHQPPRRNKSAPRNTTPSTSSSCSNANSSSTPAEAG